MVRPLWDETWFEMAKPLVERGTCLRRNYAAIIVAPGNVLVSSGYTGAPRGTPNCIDLGKCVREEMKIPSGQNYEKCRSVHGEQNAIINANKVGSRSVAGCKMYIYGTDRKGNLPEICEPCMMCWRVIINAELEEVITLSKAGIKVYSVAERIKMLNEHPEIEFDAGYGTQKKSQ